MKLIQLQILVELKKYGSFLKTAENIYTSQPSISVLIKELERELGHQLLERSNRGVTFTPFGNLVLEQANLVVQAVDRIHNLARQEEHGVYGRMTIAGPPHLCNMLLLDIQIEMEHAYPEFHLKLENRVGSDIVEAIARGKLSMGLVQFCDMDESMFQKDLKRKELEFIPLFQDRVLFVGGEDHPLVQRSQVQLNELFQYPYLSITPEINRYVDQLFQQHGHCPEIITASEFVRMRKYAAKSTAISSLPALAIQHGNQNYHDKLLPISVCGLDMVTPVGLVRRKIPCSEAETMLIRALKERCRTFRNVLYTVE